MVRLDEAPDVEPDQLGWTCVSEHGREGGIGEEDNPVPLDDNPLNRPLDQPPIALLARPKESLRSFAFGDVEDGPHEPAERSVGSEERRLVEGDVAADAVRVRHIRFVGLDAWLIEQCLVGAIVNVRKVFRRDVVDRLSDDLLPGKPEILLEGDIAAEVDPFRVLVENRGGDRVEQHLQ